MSLGKTERTGKVLRFFLGVILAVTFIRVWAGPTSWAADAKAQIPDAGSQRADLLQEVRKTNDLLRKVVKILETQSVKVEVQNAAGTAGKGKNKTRGKN